jgi:hypothetical protein
VVVDGSAISPTKLGFVALALESSVVLNRTLLNLTLSNAGSAMDSALDAVIVPVIFNVLDIVPVIKLPTPVICMKPSPTVVIDIGGSTYNL